MPTESELRALLRETSAPNTLDAAKIIRRSRVRRMPAQAAVGGVLALAVAGVGIAGINGFGDGNTDTATTLESPAYDAEDSAAGTEDAIRRAPAEKLNLCGAPPSEVDPSSSGLRLDVEFPPEVVSGTPVVEGTVIMTNAGQDRVTGVTYETPAITLSQDGIVVWHSNAVRSDGSVMIDLEPGESLEYPARFEPVRCAEEDELRETFRPGLPALPAGSYEVSAATDFTANDASDASALLVDLVTSPREPITLR